MSGSSSSSSSPPSSPPIQPQNELREAADRLQRVLRLYDQGENLYWQEKVAQMDDNIRQAVAEKNYWMKKFRELEVSQGIDRNSLDDEELVGAADHRTDVDPISVKGAIAGNRRRTNSELQVMADTIAFPGKSGIDTETNSPARASPKRISKSESSKSPFRLLQCSDEQCEVFKPTRGRIRTSHHARSNVQLIWDEKPKAVLIVKKPDDPEVTATFIQMANWMSTEKMLTVYVEPPVQKELQLTETLSWKETSEWDRLQNTIDFVVCLGGDGTILWTTGLFQHSIPPIVSFSMGSLGFLTPFSIGNNLQDLDDVTRGGFFLSLRSRLTCHLVRGNGVRREHPIDPSLTLSRNNSFQTFHALNEVVVDRGPSAAVVELDCYCDEFFVTKVTADGIIIATPTGSTAYSLSAGGSMVHPSVPAMLMTPICPHSLSFRPCLFHDSATLKITVPVTSRSSAYVSLDGRNRMEMKQGDTLYVKVSSHPVPVVCKKNEVEDWFQSVKQNLNWNQRRAQKPLSSAAKAKASTTETLTQVSESLRNLKKEGVGNDNKK